MNVVYNTNVFNNNDEYKKIQKEDILNKISEIDIFKKYLGNIKIGGVYKSPLREDDNPSFGIFVSNRDNALLYKDLATGDCGDVFKFVKKLYDLRLYTDVYRKIISDMNLSVKTGNIARQNKIQKYELSESKKITINRTAFNKTDIEFWNSYGISVETLRLYSVWSISRYYVNGIQKDIYSILDPMYAYKIFDKFKIYKPKSQKINKWRGNLSSLDMQGFEQLPEKGDLLIITKSLKDVMLLHEFGYTAIAPPSESTIIVEAVMNNLKKRFKNIIIFYDRDKTGMTFARKLSKMYKLNCIFINKKYKTKDISDFYKKFGCENTKNILIEITKYLGGTDA